MKSRTKFLADDCLELLDSMFPVSYFFVMELFLDGHGHFGSGYSLSTGDLLPYRDISG